MRLSLLLVVESIPNLLLQQEHTNNLDIEINKLNMSVKN
jgi:ABC-type uncharacterized transport system ATPase component